MKLTKFSKKIIAIVSAFAMVVAGIVYAPSASVSANGTATIGRTTYTATDGISGDWTGCVVQGIFDNQRIHFAWGLDVDADSITVSVNDQAIQNVGGKNARGCFIYLSDVNTAINNQDGEYDIVLNADKKDDGEALSYTAKLTVETDSSPTTADPEGYIDVAQDQWAEIDNFWIFGGFSARHMQYVGTGSYDDMKIKMKGNETAQWATQIGIKVPGLTAGNEYDYSVVFDSNNATTIFTQVPGAAAVVQNDNISVVEGENTISGTFTAGSNPAHGQIMIFPNVAPDGTVFEFKSVTVTPKAIESSSTQAPTESTSQAQTESTSEVQSESSTEASQVIGNLEGLVVNYNADVKTLYTAWAAYQGAVSHKLFIDGTEFADIDNGANTNVAALAAGNHNVRIDAFNGDGVLIARGTANFTKPEEVTTTQAPTESTSQGGGGGVDPYADQVWKTSTDGHYKICIIGQNTTNEFNGTFQIESPNLYIAASAAIIKPNYKAVSVNGTDLTPWAGAYFRIPISSLTDNADNTILVDDAVGGSYTLILRAGTPTFDDDRLEVSDYIEGGERIAPTETGKVFAGWYSDAEFTTPYLEDNGKAYPKFIDEKVLNGAYQVDDETTPTAVRFISTIDTTDYSNIGFKIVGKYGDVEENNINVEKDVKKIYTSITAAGTKYYPGSTEGFSAESAYFFTYTIRGLAAGTTLEVKYTPYFITLDGTKVYGAEKTYQSNN